MVLICHEHCPGVGNEYYSIADTDNILKTNINKILRSSEFCEMAYDQNAEKVK